MGTYYTLCGVVIESATTLPALSACRVAASNATIKFDVQHEPRLFADAVWIRHTGTTSAGGEPFMSTARVHDGYIVRFHPGIDFWISSEGKRVVAYARESPIDSIEQLLLDQVLPQALNLVGMCSLHASCVALDDGAVAFLGASGEGKSTLASALVPPGRLLADDCLTLHPLTNEVLVWPSYPSVRLRRDSVERLDAPGRPVSARMTWKYRVDLARAPQPATLKRVYLLRHADRVEIGAVSGLDAMGEIIRHVHRLDPEHRRSLDTEVANLTWMLARVAVRDLRYPRRYEVLPDVLQAVLHDS
jgi:hypothetical protein